MLIYFQNKNKWIWWFLLFILLLLVAMIAFIAIYKIESKVSGFVRIDNLDSTNLFIESQEGYKFKIGDEVSFKVNDKFYHSIIKVIYYDELTKKLCMQVEKISLHFTPGTIIPVNVITGYESILHSIIGSV